MGQWGSRANIWVIWVEYAGVQNFSSCMFSNQFEMTSELKAACASITICSGWSREEKRIKLQQRGHQNGAAQ